MCEFDPNFGPKKETIQNCDFYRIPYASTAVVYDPSDKRQLRLYV